METIKRTLTPWLQSPITTIALILVAGGIGWLAHQSPAITTSTSAPASTGSALPAQSGEAPSADAASTQAPSMKPPVVGSLTTANPAAPSPVFGTRGGPRWPDEHLSDASGGGSVSAPPAEPRSAEPRSANQRPAGPRAAERRPVEQRPVEQHPAQHRPTEQRPVQRRLAMASPTLSPPSTSDATGEAVRQPGEDASDSRPSHPASSSDPAGTAYRDAYAAMNLGRTEEAIAGMQAALRENPNYFRARQELSQLLIEQHRLDEAAPLLEEGLQRDPARWQFALSLARIQAERGQLDAAAETLRKDAAAAAANPGYQGFRAAVEARLGHHEEAIAAYTAALRGVPDAGIWWMGLGLSLEAVGKNAEAHDAYQVAIASGKLSAELLQFVQQKAAQPVREAAPASK